MRVTETHGKGGGRAGFSARQAPGREEPGAWAPRLGARRLVLTPEGSVSGDRQLSGDRAQWIGSRGPGRWPRPLSLPAVGPQVPPWTPRLGFPSAPSRCQHLCGSSWGSGTSTRDEPRQTPTFLLRSLKIQRTCPCRSGLSPPSLWPPDQTAGSTPPRSRALAPEARGRGAEDERAELKLRSS